MTEKEFEQRFAKAWGTAMSEDEINKLILNAVANTPDPITSAVKILMEYQLCTTKAVLKEFFLNDKQ